MEDPQRPLPPRSPSDRARGWIEWFGLGRIVGSAVAMVVVCAGAYWLIRTPPPPTEAMLPTVSTTAASPDGVDTPSSSALAANDAANGTATAASTPADSASAIVVHVAGAVAVPGVYELVPDARVQGAIIAAGGPLPDADPNSLNLAAPLSDGSRIYVPRVGEEVPPSVIAAGAPAGTVEIATPIVDVNAATAATLEELPGVGPATATAIVTERDRNGPFLSVDDLDRVPGIGPAKIEALRELVTT